ncbi:hypothetical protein ANN_01760 [Periplaneta americana]|uniref:Transposase n=1 Tax=Periplaneta americana TaxID=6978 RepID=A0ABQ8TUE5_PERAM|nr:hypothetical protein ANN_01760 [Periplaneta americana]
MAGLCEGGNEPSGSLKVIYSHCKHVLDMLQLYAVPQLPDGAIFQQDGAPPHFANMVRTFLDEQFPAWIGRGSPYITWPARSPDNTT